MIWIVGIVWLLLSIYAIVDIAKCDKELSLGTLITCLTVMPPVLFIYWIYTIINFNWLELTIWKKK